MKTIRMTDRWVRTISVDVGRDEFCDAILRGLRLRVSPISRKWSVVTRRGGKLVRLPIGDFPEISLADARERANRLQETNAATDDEDTPFPEGEALPLLETLCVDYVEQMKRNGQVSHDAYHRALIRSEGGFCKYMERHLGRQARAIDVKQEHAVGWLREVFQRSPAHSRHCLCWVANMSRNAKSISGTITASIPMSHGSTTHGRNTRLSSSALRTRSTSFSMRLVYNNGIWRRWIKVRRPFDEDPLRQTRALWGDEALLKSGQRHNFCAPSLSNQQLSRVGAQGEFSALFRSGAPRLGSAALRYDLFRAGD